MIGKWQMMVRRGGSEGFVLRKDTRWVDVNRESGSAVSKETFLWCLQISTRARMTGLGLPRGHSLLQLELIANQVAIHHYHNQDPEHSVSEPAPTAM